MPITPQLLGPSAPPGIWSAICARLLAVGRMPPVTPITHEIWSGSFSRPMSSSGSRLATWPASKHSCSGLMPSSFIAVEELDDRVEGVLEDRLEDELLALARVLRVVHRAHVQRGDVGAQLAQVLDALLDRDADRAGRVVDDHVVDLGVDRLGDRAEVLDLVARRAVRRASVDVDHRAALVDDPARLGARTPRACRGSPGTGRGWRRLRRWSR